MIITSILLNHHTTDSSKIGAMPISQIKLERDTNNFSAVRII